MTAMWAAREHHRFEAAGRPFVYLVPSAAIFELDEASDLVLRTLSERPRTREELTEAFGDAEPAIAELARVQAIAEVSAPPAATPKIIPLAPFPLTTMVLNVTNQCNLSCTYCYEYGEDKIVDTENGKQPKFMSEETARASAEFMLKETGTSEVAHIKRIYTHLTEEMGFWEVGFAQVTTSPERGHAISDTGYDDMLGQFRDLAYEFLEAAVQNRHHGFSNVKETLEELHKGVSKAFPCGAGLGLLGVATDGDVALCHRFAGSDAHKVGSVTIGVDRQAQAAFLEKHHIANKTDCSVCWARPLCSGGCYHEAHTRYGDTGHANLHYCEWIRGWTDVCLQIYGELSARNPAFLAQFDDQDTKEMVS